MTSSRVPSTRPRRPASGNSAKPLDLHPDAVIHDDGCPWAVRFDVVEDRVAVALRQNGPLQPHERSHLCLSHLAQRRRSPLGEARFDLFVRNAGTRIVERVLHFGAEPGIMCGGVIG